MGPSLTAREPRRSSRRPTHTPASRSSLSPSSANHFPAVSDQHTPPTPSRILPSSALKRSSSSSKRVKQEPDDTVPQHNSRPHMDNATIPTANGRAKRRPKDKVEVVLPTRVIPDPPAQNVVVPDAQDDNDDDGGITRCVCGRTGASDPVLLVAWVNQTTLQSWMSMKKTQGLWLCARLAKSGNMAFASTSVRTPRTKTITVNNADRIFTWIYSSKFRQMMRFILFSLMVLPQISQKACSTLL